MDMYTAFSMILDSIKDNTGYEDSIFDEFIIGFEDEYKKCKDILSKKFSAFLEKNEFLHDSEIVGVSVKSYVSNQKYLCDIVMQIKTSQRKEVRTIIYKKASKFTVERYKESDYSWTWGYGYFKKLEDNYIEQGIICFPGSLIKIKCKKIVLG
ncbi:hypothetical protein [Acetivibrio cellulolyticus]|uniref:hypothetical protein n=1 Tax=Acetivibrio cellulolyticus TaxID=35830 RepID=UPI0001E3019D|nr:hypothetical protein [Acetivibrio cellulolyticus]